MKKGWMFLLLISIGLNLGLGLRLVRLGHPAALPGPGEAEWRGRGGSRWERPAPNDTTAWRQFMGRRLEHLADRLDLRPEQVESLQSAQTTTRRQMRQKRRELFQVRTRLGKLMAAETIDRQAVRRAMVEMGRHQVEMDSLAAETMLGELELLDPAQRVRYLDFLPDRTGRGPGRGGRGRDLTGG